MTNFAVVDDTFDPGITLSYFLSIQINLDGFSFCILDPVKNKYIQIQHISFNQQQKIEEQINQCFREVDKLNLPYKKTLILIPSNQATLVPSALFDTGNYSDWLTFSNNLNDRTVLLYNKIKMADAFNVFTVPEKIFSIMKRQFPDPWFFQQYTPIIESNLATSMTNFKDTLLYINIEKKFFDLLAFKNNNLKLCNSFKMKSDNDFIYFTLFAFEQLKLSPAETNIVVGGNHPDFHNLTDHLKQYIKNVNYNNIPRHFQYSHLFRNINNHAYYNMLTLPICV